MVEVPGRGRDRPVPELLGDDPDVQPLLAELGGVGVGVCRSPWAWTRFWMPARRPSIGSSRRRYAWVVGFPVRVQNTGASAGRSRHPERARSHSASTAAHPGSIPITRE